MGHSKDFWSGVIFLTTGIGFVGFGRDYPMGTAMSMGPAYFPTVLGGLLALIGLILIVRVLLRPGPAVGSLALGKLGLVTASNVLFALLLRRLGLVGALTQIHDLQEEPGRQRSLVDRGSPCKSQHHLRTLERI